mmetsp:Transcript_33676/g.108777  ORF Transcript_33676/g.108777 Transcript_33676/m.108777 type:complete len:97 (-) Transcript_33676:1028-1318(-)
MPAAAKRQRTFTPGVDDRSRKCEGLTVDAVKPQPTKDPSSCGAPAALNFETITLVAPAGRLQHDPGAEETILARRRRWQAAGRLRKRGQPIRPWAG